MSRDKEVAEKELEKHNDRNEEIKKERERECVFVFVSVSVSVRGGESVCECE